MTPQLSSDVVLDVAPDEQEAYSRCAYHDYLRAWNERVEALRDARRAGAQEQIARLEEELRHVWPQPDDVADAAWVPLPEREHPLPPDPDR